MKGKDLSNKISIIKNCNYWIWTNVSTPYSLYKQPTGKFQNGHIIIDQSSGKILSLVNSETNELENWQNHNNYEEYDIEGKFILPGLHDSHIHVLFNAISRSFLNLEGAKSIEEIGKLLIDYHKKNPNLTWIVGIGWEQQRFTVNNGIMPNITDLDNFTIDLPIILIRRCFHVFCCNTLAFKKCNLDPKIPDSWDLSEKLKSQFIFENSFITGIVIEDATEIFNQAMISELTNLKDLLYKELKFLAANGIVGVQSNDPQVGKYYTQLDKERDLPIRVFHTIFFEELLEWLKDVYKSFNPSEESISLEKIFKFLLNESSDQYTHLKLSHYFKPAISDSLLSCDRIKIFADGSLGAKTAAIRYPYLINDNNSLKKYSNKYQCKRSFGVLRESSESFELKLKLIKKLNLRVEVHAIGDAAAELAIDGMIANNMGNSKDRPVLTHCQLLGSDLIKKMSQNNIIANIQPSFLPSDLPFIEKNLPKELINYAYIWKTLLNEGIVCSGGSDAPIEHPNPLKGIFDAMYRPKSHFLNKSIHISNNYIKELNNDQNFELPLTSIIPDLQTPPEAYNIKECITFAEALQIYTIHGIYAANCDMHNNKNIKLGKLEKGFMADFIVLDKDISQQSYNTLLNANIMQTWVSGKRVFNLIETKAYKLFNI